MARGDVFFAGMAKTALKACIRDRLKAYAIGEVFEDDLISDLISQKHYYCSVNGLRPTHFRMLFRPGGGYDFQGQFTGSRWHGVSWTQCLDPRSHKEDVEVALRDAVQSIVAARRSSFPVCERCKQKPSTEVDHVAPEFSEIVRNAMATMTQKDFDEAFADFDWWEEERFQLPRHCPALIYTLEAHKTAQLQAVCKDCHLKNAKDRKSTQTDGTSLQR